MNDGGESSRDTNVQFITSLNFIKKKNITSFKVTSFDSLEVIDGFSKCSGWRQGDRSQIEVGYRVNEECKTGERVCR